MTNPDDKVLVMRAQNGDEVALEALILRYGWLVRSVIRKYFVASGTEEDLYQEGCLAIPKAIKRYDPEKNGNVMSYLTMCIDADIKDALRSATREKHKILNDAVSLTSLSENTDGKVPSEYIYDPVHNFIEREGLDIFYENVGKICSELHVKILRYYLDGYTYAQIASILGIPEKKVDNAMMRVKKKIKENKNLFS